MGSRVVELAAMSRKTFLKTVFFLMIAALAGGVLSSPALAKSWICITTYGGGEECYESEKEDYDIEKKVTKTGEGIWKDKISGLTAGDKVYFKVTVKNTGDVDADDAEIRDELPRYLEDPKEVGGDGDFEFDGDDIEIDVDDFDAGEEKEFVYRARVIDDLPDNAKFCSYNIASLYVDGHKEGSDDAEVCFETGEVLGEVSELPQAGATPLGVVLAGAMLVVGWGLRRWSLSG